MFEIENAGDPLEAFVVVARKASEEFGEYGAGCDDQCRVLIEELKEFMLARHQLR